MVATCFVVRTIAVYAAFDANTSVLRIADQPWRASALGAVVNAVAFRVRCAWIAKQAWIQALGVITSSAICAIRVGFAFHLHATVLRTAGVTRLAGADCVMIADGAIGVGSAITRTDA